MRNATAGPHTEHGWSCSKRTYILVSFTHSVCILWELACVHDGRDTVKHCDGARPRSFNVVPLTRLQRSTQENPLHEIFGSRMSPWHVAPVCPIAIVLVENVVVALIVHRTCNQNTSHAHHWHIIYSQLVQVCSFVKGLKLCILRSVQEKERKDH
jgi:hypothetical protein